MKENVNTIKCIFLVCLMIVGVLLTACNQSTVSPSASNAIVSSMESNISTASSESPLSSSIEEPSSQNIASSLYGSSSTSAHDNFNEKEFKNFMNLFCRFVNAPITSSEDLEDLKEQDLFPLLVHLAETYASLQNKSYATQESTSTYRFPLADLQRLSNYIFDFDFDFESAKTLSYVAQDGKTINGFDPTTNEFFVIFTDAPYPVREDGLLVSLIDIPALEHVGNSITAVCQLEYSHGLGTSPEIKNVTYHFEIIIEDGIAYYQIKGVE